MERKPVFYCLVTVICTLLLIVGIKALYAQQTIEATLGKASPETSAGACPRVINFKGTIIAKSPGKIQYEFVVRDGDEEKTQPGGTLDFSVPGKQDVIGELVFGDEGESKHTGWVMIRVSTPIKVESNKSNYFLRCSEEQQT